MDTAASLVGAPAGLTDGGVLLREWLEADVAVLAAADDYVAMIEDLPVPWDDARGRAWIERQRSQTRGWSLAVDIAGAAVGGVGIVRRHSPGVGAIGYWMLEGQRGHGLAERGERRDVFIYSLLARDLA